MKMKKMNNEKLEKEYKEIVKKTKKQYLGKAIILLFCLLFLLYIDKFVLLVMIDLFLSFFFSVEYFVLNITYKNIYDYCTLKKEFPGKKMEISMDKFEKMLDEGIPASTYFLIDDTILTIECSQKYYFVNYLELSSKEEVLNQEVDERPIMQAKKIYLLMYDGGEARNYLTE